MTLENNSVDISESQIAACGWGVKKGLEMSCIITATRDVPIPIPVSVSAPILPKTLVSVSGSTGVYAPIRYHVMKP